MSGIIFDSGTVESNSSVNVQLEGLQLQPSTRYYWRVTVTDNHGETAVSQPGAYFETGLLGSGWSGAQWIASGSGAPQTSEPGADLIKDYGAPQTAITSTCGRSAQKARCHASAHTYGTTAIRSAWPRSISEYL